MRWERCTFETQDQSIIIEIDLAIDNDLRVNKHLAYYGMWRDYHGPFYPFLCTFEGIDYGSALKKPNRGGQFYIRGERLVPGSNYTYRGDDEATYHFVFRKSVDLLR